MALPTIELTAEPVTVEQLWRLSTQETKFVWVIYPQQRQVVAHYPDGPAKTLQAADTLSAETVLAEFSCQVGDIFG
jgi:hypothetical protein